MLHIGNLVRKHFLLLSRSYLSIIVGVAQRHPQALLLTHHMNVIQHLQEPDLYT